MGCPARISTGFSFNKWSMIKTSCFPMKSKTHFSASSFACVALLSSYVDSNFNITRVASSLKRNHTILVPLLQHLLKQLSFAMIVKTEQLYSEFSKLCNIFFFLGEDLLTTDLKVSGSKKRK